MLLFRLWDVEISKLLNNNKNNTFNLAQSIKSLDKSTSSTVQNEAIKKRGIKLIILDTAMKTYQQPFCKMPICPDTELVRLQIVRGYLSVVVRPFPIL